MKAGRTVEIRAPAQKIWPYLVEQDKLMRWMIADKFELTSEQKSGVGATFYLEAKTGGRVMKYHCVFTESVENERIRWRLTSGDVKSMDGLMTIEPTETGSRFTLRLDIGLPYGIIGKVMGLFIRKQIEKIQDQELAILKRLAEA